ncbi:MAG TPA: hypothetical protein VGK38_11145 [Prolixibacteraceae bacterium]|jgi:hypothetical protein
MKVDLKKLAEIISRLPDPQTYHANEYHAIISTPPSLYPYSGSVPEISIAKELVFKKQFNRGKYEWFLEY